MDLNSTIRSLGFAQEAIRVTKNFSIWSTLFEKIIERPYNYGIYSALDNENTW
jgi:hypothetical protein